MQCLEHVFLILCASVMRTTKKSVADPDHPFGRGTPFHSRPPKPRKANRSQLDGLRQTEKGHPPFPSFLPCQSPITFPSFSSPRSSSTQIQLGSPWSAGGIWVEPQPKSNFVHFSLKISKLVATILVMLLRIN